MKRKLVYLALIALTILHHDFWWWDDSSLVLGFLPVGLAYHVFYSCLLAFVWHLALTYAWPSDAVAFAEGRDDLPEDERP